VRLERNKRPLAHLEHRIVRTPECCKIKPEDATPDRLEEHDTEQEKKPE
jgi:hypothetical protein